MKVRKLAAVSVLAAGMGAAGMMGAGTASALGFSYHDGTGDPVTVGTGATSDVKEGNRGLAISLFGTASTTTSGTATGNNLLAIDGVASATGSAKNNNVVAVSGTSSAEGDSNGNTIVNVGGKAVSKEQGNKPGVFSLSACGTSFTGQAAHVTVSQGTC